jgi:hypothetical protein
MSNYNPNPTQSLPKLLALHGLVVEMCFGVCFVSVGCLLVLVRSKALSAALETFARR